MGKGSDSVQSGWWYRVAFHHGVSSTPVDAVLEIRGGDQVAWSGELTASGNIFVNRPTLWGGEKDQGGIVGTWQWMFGEATQEPNAYLQRVFGDQVPGWRGVTTCVFTGGKFGANNPYPQRPAYKIRVIQAGWDDTCWYPEKAAVPLLDGAIQYHGDGWDYQVEDFTEPNTAWSNWDIPADGWTAGGQMPFGTGGQWTPMRSNLWVRRTITALVDGLTLHIGAENGCVVFVDGVQTGGSNLENESIASNQNNPVNLPLTAGTTFELVVKAFAEIDASDDAGNVLQVGLNGAIPLGMNPAHILYELMTSADRGGEPTESMNAASWTTAADWYYANGIGLCTEHDPAAESVEDAKTRIERVAGCSVSRSPADGQWYVDIANGIYDFDALPILTDDDILGYADKPTLLDDVVNSISVEYFDPKQKLTITTPPVQALALVTANGLIHSVNQYHEVPTAALATRMAQRDLRARITPTHAFDITTTRVPWSWRPFTYFRLQAPKRGIADMVCLLAEKSTGTLRSGAIQITAAQDIYSVPSTSYVQVESGVDTRRSQTPVVIAHQVAFEAPYTTVAATLSAANFAALDGGAGFVMAVAVDPSGSRDFTMQVSVHGLDDYAEVADGQWCPSALIVEGDARADAAPETDFTLSGGALLDTVVVGAAALWDSEIVRVDAIDVDAGTLTLGRGCADTVPAVHAAASRIYFYGGAAAKDPTEYTDGDELDVRLLSNTGTNQLAGDSATVITLTMADRLARPYPPAQVTLAGDWYPSTATGAVVVTWAPRDAVTQADQLLDTSVAGVTGPETIRYGMRLLDADGAELIARDDIDGNTATFELDYTGDATLELWSITDAGESLQRHRITVAYTPSGSPATAITADAYAGTTQTVIHDGGTVTA